MNTLEQEKINFLNDIENIEEKYNVKILLAYVRGSHMYGTSNEKSDVDITFVYQQPTDEILKSNYKEQISIGKNDVVGYEIQRFLQLLSQNNPNILESLDIPEDCLIYKHSHMDEILDQKIWLSKLTKNTILGYAQSQIKKATGLNKHMNRQDVEKKDLIDFCYVIHHDQTKSLRTFTLERGIDIEKVGLSKAGNGKGIYFMYLDNDNKYHLRGLLKDSESTQLRLSSIPKELSDSGMFHVIYYNQDGYEVWNKEYQSYQKWLLERNENRYDDNLKAGKSFDLKNMMHLRRLLEMAYRIANGEGLQVRAKNVEYLREIRNGKHDYDFLMQKAEELTEVIKSNFEKVNLPDSVDIDYTKNILLKFRTR